MKVDAWLRQDPNPCDNCGTGSHAWAFFYFLKRAGDDPWLTWNADGTFNIYRRRPDRASSQSGGQREGS